MPVMMLKPLAWPSVLTKVPSVVPRAAAASAAADHHHRQRERLAAPVQFHHEDAENDQQQHLHQGGHHLSKDRAEQVGAFAGGGGQQAAQGAFLAFVGEHGRDADQRDEDPGDQLPGRRIGARVVVDRVLGVALGFRDPAGSCGEQGLGLFQGRVEIGLPVRRGSEGLDLFGLGHAVDWRYRRHC